MQRLNLKKAVTLLSCTAALTACDPLDTLSSGESPEAMNAEQGQGLGQQTAAFGLSRPPILQSRAVNRDLLRPTVTVGVGASSEVPMTRNGERWSGSFSLPDDTGTELARYPLNIEWLYDTQAFTGGSPGNDIVLARAPEQIISNASNRQISVSDDDYSTDFDDDNDGTTNLAELEADRNPLMEDRDVSPVAPNDQQSDCRDLVIGLISRLPPIIRLSSSFSETQSIERANGVTVFGQAFFVEASGTLTVEKLAGLPDEGGMLLFDRALDAEAERGIAADNVAPLSVAAPLLPGLYCLGVVVSDLETQVFSDVSVRYTFAPSAP